MNYTQNHHLPQWVKSDRIMMDDFNAAMANIESGITTAQSTASSAASAASRAQSTANTARTEAAAKPYVTGSYTGTGANLTINLGFRPSFVIISGLKEDYGADRIVKFGIYGCMTTGGAGTVDSCIQFTSSGFTVLKSTPLPDLTNSGHVYEYIAFK